jgi:hypothetical protein
MSDLLEFLTPDFHRGYRWGFVIGVSFGIFIGGWFL